MNSLLVIAPSWIGDMVMAQSLFKVFMARSPGSTIDVLAPGWTLPLLKYMPEVRDGIQMPLGHGDLKLKVRHRLGVSLRKRHYNQAIVLPNSFKSALVPFWARIPRRTGYAAEMRQCLLNDARRLDSQRLPMTVQRFVALALPDSEALPDPVPRPRLSATISSGTAAARRLGLACDGQPVLALCPGAEFGPAKQWPQEYYAELASHWIGEGWHVWLFGSKNDQPVCGRVSELAGHGCINLAGKTSLEEAIDLLNLAACVVSNDSGLMHVAAALHRKMVAIYGSSDPGFTPPLSRTAQVQWLGLECSPCFKRECPLGHLKCLRDLKAGQVIHAMEEVLVQ